MHGYIETTKTAKLLFNNVLREDSMFLDFWEELLKSVYLGKKIKSYCHLINTASTGNPIMILPKF